MSLHLHVALGLLLVGACAAPRAATPERPTQAATAPAPSPSPVPNPAPAPTPAPSPVAPAVTASVTPNVILLMADQFRADALGCEGRTPARTPNLDRLALEGCRFERAYSSTPSCTPARTELLTGLSPWSHGLLGYGAIAPRYPVELPRFFAEAGYATHAIGKNHFHPQRSTHGYETIELDESGRVESEDFVSDYRQWFASEAPDLDPDATQIGWNDYRPAAYALPERLHPTTWTGDRAVAFLEEYDGERPFLLKVSFARPHSPFDPPQRLLESYADVETTAPVTGDWSEALHGGVSRPLGYRAARNNLGAEVTSASRRAYYASVTFVDEQVGRILAALEATGRAQETIIVFVSDHGDMLGDHHLWRKTYAYEGSARIPMLLWWGSAALSAPRGQVFDEPVALRDVLPTLADASGLAIPALVEGRSLLDLVLARGRGWREVLDLEHAEVYWRENVWTALTDGRWKYIYYARDGREQLFDLDTDPGEARDLAGTPAHDDTLASWRARMVEHLAPRGAPWVVDGRLGLRMSPIVRGPNYPTGSD